MEEFKEIERKDAQNNETIKALRAKIKKQTDKIKEDTDKLGVRRGALRAQVGQRLVHSVGPAACVTANRVPVATRTPSKYCVLTLVACMRCPCHCHPQRLETERSEAEESIPRQRQAAEDLARELGEAEAGLEELMAAVRAEVEEHHKKLSKVCVRAVPEMACVGARGMHGRKGCTSGGAAGCARPVLRGTRAAKGDLQHLKGELSTCGFCTPRL